MTLIGIHGSYFGYNFGDTLLCYLFTKWVRSAAPQARVHLPLANGRNRRAIGADTSGALAASSDALLFCGGGYFSEPKEASQRWSVRNYFRHVVLGEVTRFRRKPFSIMGVGAGPISSRWLRQRVASLFSDASTVIVRDEESATHLRSWGVTRDLIVASDAALSITPHDVTPPADRVQELLASLAAEKVLLIHTTVQPDETERAVMNAAAQWAADHPDIGVIVATDSVSRRGPVRWPHHLLQSHPRLRNRSGIYLYDGRPDQLMNLLGAVEGVITTKLHVGIVGTALEKPVFSVPRHSKTPRFYKQMNLSDQCFPQWSDWHSRLMVSLDAWNAGACPDFRLKRHLAAQQPYRVALADFLAQVR